MRDRPRRQGLRFLTAATLGLAIAAGQFAAGPLATRVPAVAPLAGAVVAPVAGSDELDEERARLAALVREARERAAKLDALGDERSGLSRELRSVEADVVRTEQSIAETRLAILDTRLAIEALDERIATLLAEQATLRATVGELYRTLYELQRRTGLELFLDGDFVAWASKEASTTAISGELRSMEAGLARVEAAARAERAARAALAAELGTREAALAARERALEAQRDELVRLIAAVAEAERRARVSLQAARDDVRRASLTVAQLEAEARALAAKERREREAAAAGPGPAVGTPGTITFHGRGTDHGIGLSQWGAHGRAKAGQSAAEILAHYYAGTTLGSIPDERLIRVLVVEGHRPTAGRPAKVIARRGPWSLDGVEGTFPAGSSLSLVPVGAAWERVVRASDGRVLHRAASGGDERLRPAAAATRLEVWFKPSSFDLFRGAIRLRTSGTSVRVVNELPLEAYLLGVVPAEVPGSWPIEAIKAQAIAARSYAWVHRDASNALFDVHDDTRSQVYLGVLGEKAAATAAVRATAGRVVRSGGRVANTLFHSTGGGATEHNENVYVAWDGRRLASPHPYLRGRPDRDAEGRPYDRASPRATWRTATYPLAELSAILAGDPRTDVGDLRDIRLTRRGVSGRLITVTLVGSDGTKTVSGPYFKYVFNVHSPASDPPLWSTLFDTRPVP